MFLQPNDLMNPGNAGVALETTYRETCQDLFTNFTVDLAADCGPSWKMEEKSLKSVEYAVDPTARTRPANRNQTAPESPTTLGQISIPFHISIYIYTYVYIYTYI